MSHLFQFGLLDLARAALSVPLFSLFLATPIAMFVLVGIRARDSRLAPRVTPEAAKAITGRYRPELRVLWAGALLVLLVFAAESVLHGYVLDFQDVVAWWRYALPVGVAALVLGILLVLIITRGTARPQVPFVHAERRIWTSFAPRWGVIGTCLAIIALFLTSILAGSASSNLNGGPYVYLEIPVPNEQLDPIRPWFFGWAYAMPVLISLLLLVIVLWITLRADAVRPFLRAETVHGEKAARRMIAGEALAIASAGALLALAGAWRFVADAGVGAGLEIDGEHFDVTWQYAELATVLGWAAPVVEIVAFTLLLIAVARPLRTRLPMAPVQADVDELVGYAKATA